MATGGGGKSTMKAISSFDWTRGSPPPTITSYQRYIRNFDWSKTALGPIQSWRRELRQIVLFMMAEIDPVVLYWGEHHSIIYNEAYVSLVGMKHPRLQGGITSDVFPEFWDRFGSIITEQRLDGATRAEEASMLLMDRHGYMEETYFDWKLMPVVGDEGTMLGSYSRMVESSTQVISSRRAVCIQNLAQQTSTATSLDELLSRTFECFARMDKDLPMVMLYDVGHVRDDSASSDDIPLICNLRASLGIPKDCPCALSQLDIQHDLHGIAPLMLAALRKGSLHVTSIMNAGLEHHFANIQRHESVQPSKELAFLPVKANGVVSAILVFGLNPHLAFSSRYSEFIEAVGNIVSAQMSNMNLTEQSDYHGGKARSALSEIQKSESRFCSFADRAPLGLTICSRDAKILYANEAWYAFYGLKVGESDPSAWMDVVHEEDLPAIREWWHKVIDLKQRGTFQIRSKEVFVSGDMRLPCRTGIVALYPDVDEDDNVISVMGLVTDISELKWTEEQLRLRQKDIKASEKNYRDFAEHAPIGVVQTDINGFVQFTNATWRSFYNYPEDHDFVEPEPWLSSLNREDAPGARQYFKDLASTGIARTIEVRLNRPQYIRDPRRTPPGEFWLLSSGFVNFRPDGVTKDITFWVTDISDQKAAEKVLTDKMEEAIRLKNTQERFVDMISHEIRNPLSAILHCGEEIVDAMRKCSVLIESQESDEAPAQAELTLLTPTRRYVNSALDAANTIMYCVQHQKQIVDDVLTLSKLDADLLVVSPVPIEPIELVRSALKIFQPELKASEIELAFEIDQSLRQLDVNWVMLDSNRFLQIVINLVTNAIKFTRGAQIKRIIISVSARVDRPGQEHQGVHYVPRRERTDNLNPNMIGVDPTSPKQDLYLCFSVADTGKGLTESERTILFNRFAQASPKTHIEYGGSGLGLFISRQITEMLGGEIGVGSEPGKGATFAFYVRTQRTKPPRRASLGAESLSVYTKTLMTPTPGTWVTGHNELPPGLDTKHSSVQEKSRPVLPTPEPTTSKRRVLVVEDNLINQKVLCKQLRNRGFLVEAANHGREALEALERTHHGDQSSYFDVILCDIEMPIMNGIECVTEIRRLENEGRFKGHIPIIGVTANVRSKQVNAAIEAGMDGVTTKPYRIDELIAHIDRVATEVESSKSL